MKRKTKERNKRKTKKERERKREKLRNINTKMYLVVLLKTLCKIHELKKEMF